MLKVTENACPTFASTDLELAWGDILGAWSHGPWRKA